MATKLSAVQQTALNRLAETPSEWHTAFGLRQSYATLQALYKKGLVDRKASSSSHANAMYKSSVIQFRIKQHA